jgi:3-hydroxyisobutyrate dehydrogenase
MGGPGAGMAAKIARNVIVYGCLRAGYEGATLARAAGVDLRQFVQGIEDSTDGVGGPMMLMRRLADPLIDPAEVKICESLRSLLCEDLDTAIELGPFVEPRIAACGTHPPH